MHKICLVSCFLGTFPDYFNFYIHSANFNKDIDFLIFTDNVLKEEYHGNIRLLPISFDSFNELASNKLGLKIEMSYAFKLNDYKPAYGIIFEDFLRGYDYWASCDIDIIWGNIRKFLTSEYLRTIDILHTREHWTTGHFTLFKNNECNNSLFKHCPTWKEIFTSDTYFQFEESCRRWSGKQYSIEELVAQNLTVSLYDIVTNFSKSGKIHLTYLDEIREQPKQPNIINYKFSNGNLKDLALNKDFLYYHLIVVKKIWRFYIPALATPEGTYRIDRFGMRDYNRNVYKACRWWVRKCIYSGKHILSVLRSRMKRKS